MAKKRNIEETCFPVPKNFLMPAAPAPVNPSVKANIFRQTVQAAFQIKIPYNFTSSYTPEKPYQLATEDQIAMVASFFEALNPQDAIEMAIAQQFIIVHIHAIESAKDGLGDRDLKIFELSHQIIETFQKFRTKGAQLIQVQYNHNQGQINNLTINENSNKNETIDVC